MLYRDCHSAEAEFDNPAYVSVYRKDNTSSPYFPIYFLSVPLYEINDNFTASEADCMNVEYPFCIEEGVYIFQASLPQFPPNENYHIIYQRCCKVVEFTNIPAPADIGITLVAEVTWKAKQLGNNSPVLNPNTFFKVCAGEGFSFDISATDNDSNQILYEFCSPVFGAGLIGTPEFPGDPNSCEGVQPNPSCPPPFDTVTFLGPIYTYFDPLGTNSTLELDSETGEISGIAYNIGQFLVGVCVKEFDNGELISESHQDLVFRVDFEVNDSEPEMEKLSFHPNPAKEIIYIDLPGQPEVFELFVRDINGKLITHIPKIGGPNYELNLSGLKGVYILQLQSVRKNYIEKMVVL